LCRSASAVAEQPRERCFRETRAEEIPIGERRVLRLELWLRAR